MAVLESYIKEAFLFVAVHTQEKPDCADDASVPEIGAAPKDVSSVSA
jgi:hypothetical protein